MNQAAPYVDAIGETDDLDLQFAVGTIRARQGDVDTARAAFARLLAREPNRAAAVAAEGERLAALNPDAALVHLEAAADIFVLHGDFAAAATASEAFVLQQPDHIAALLRLVEISVGWRVTRRDGAQASLVDAYLSQGNAAEARTLTEELLARQPDNPAHVQRLSKALALLGETPHVVEDSELDLGGSEQAGEPEAGASAAQAEPPPVDSEPSGDETGSVPARSRSRSTFETSSAIRPHPNSPPATAMPVSRPVRRGRSRLVATSTKCSGGCASKRPGRADTGLPRSTTKSHSRTATWG